MDVSDLRWGALLFERVYQVIAAQPWFVRGLVWTGAIFAIEYTAGWLIRRTTGECPWDYRGARLAVDGLIRLDYAPAWFVLGLLFERVHLAWVRFFP